MKYFLALSALLFLSGCALNTPLESTEQTQKPFEPAESSGLDQCINDSDCFDQGIDTSFCADGNWSCLQGQCQFACSIN